MPLPLPRDWYAFEDLCCDLWSKIWKDPNTQKHGRQGQPQSGVDIYGQPENGQTWAGVQCKYKEQKALTAQEIQEEVKKARTFHPTLTRFIVATTSPRDAKLQKAIRLIHQAEKQAGSFSVTVCFWDFISAKLTQEFPEFARKYYPEFILPEAQALAKLEISIERDEHVDFVALTPIYLSENLTAATDTELYAYLSDIRIANHDSSPTEIQRVWVVAKGSKSEHATSSIREEKLIGRRRIEARGQQRYELEARYILPGRIPQDETTQIMLRAKATGLGGAEIRLDNVFSAPPHRAESAKPTSSAPVPPELVGRDTAYRKLLSTLRDSDLIPVVGIWGMGGNGKTFLASKVTQELIHDPAGFSQLVAIESRSARPSQQSRDTEVLTYDVILNKIIETIRGWIPTKWTISEKEADVKDILSHHRILILVDNLETAKDNLAIGIGGLITLFSGTPSKALLVSRFPLPCYSEELDRLEELHAREYARRRLLLVGIYDTSIIPGIAESSGGSPLAIELAAGLISKLPRVATPEWEASVQEVLDRMHAIRKRHSTAMDPTMAFFLDVFDLSWNRRSEDNDMIYFLVGSSPQSPFALAYLCTVASLSADIVSEQLRELYELALVHIISSNGKTAYFLHPLTDAWARFNLENLSRGER